MSDPLLGGEVCMDDSTEEFGVSPGAVAMFDVGPVFISGEARFNIIFAEETASALFIGGGVGATF